MLSVIATIQDLVENKELLFGNEVTVQLPQMRSVAQLLEGLLFGLVPIRARLVNYRAASVNGREVLIHLSVLDQLPLQQNIETNTAFVVGVAQQDLFWKDIRQVLFSQAKYTTFCRLATSGMANRWNPVKAADVLAGIIPRFDEMMRDFSEQISAAMKQAPEASALVDAPSIQQLM